MTLNTIFSALASKALLPYLAPLCVSVWCTMCAHVLVYLLGKSPLFPCTVTFLMMMTLSVSGRRVHAYLVGMHGDLEFLNNFSSLLYFAGMTNFAFPHMHLHCGWKSANANVWWAGLHLHRGWKKLNWRDMCGTNGLAHRALLHNRVSWSKLVPLTGKISLTNAAENWHLTKPVDRIRVHVEVC